jgi:hypothetical protein
MLQETENEHSLVASQTNHHSSRDLMAPPSGIGLSQSHLNASIVPFNFKHVVDAYLSNLLIYILCSQASPQESAPRSSRCSSVSSTSGAPVVDTPGTDGGVTRPQAQCFYCGGPHLIEDCPQGSTSEESDGDLGFDVTHGEFWQMGQDLRNRPPSPDSGQSAAGPTVGGEDVSLVCDY